MPKELRNFPRPANDNGRGLHGSLDAGWNGGEQGLDYWVNLLVEMNIKWFKIIDDRGNSLPLCEKLVAAGIFPIVRILRHDPPPNDSPEPNPGHIGALEETTIRRLISIGVQYFETNNEPDLTLAWKHNAIPGNPVEAAKLVALNWLFDARFILAAGGLPGVPAISNGGNMDLMGALVALGRQEILLDGCWIALHNYSRNRPLNFPDDPINRFGPALTAEQYNLGALTRWAWFDTATGEADSIETVNELRANSANPASTIQQDHAGFREFEYYNSLAMKYLGHSIPIISTEGGAIVGRREDLRYPRVTPEMHRDHTVAVFDWMQRQAPDYYFAATPTLLIESDERPADAWHSAFWQRAFRDAPFGFDGIPNLAVPGVQVADRLPVIDAVKAMQNLARRLPGAQPAPPVQPIITTTPRPAPPKIEPVPARTAQPEFPSWLRDEPPPKPQPIKQSAPAEKKIVPPPPSPEHDEPKVQAPVPPPPETPEHLPAAVFEPALIPEDLEWDWRLDALGVSIDPANVEPGQAYWRLARADYQGPGESNDEHRIQYTIVDQQNKPMTYQKVWRTWSEGKADAVTNDAGKASIALESAFAPAQGEHGASAAWVDGLPCDRVTGLGLPMKQNVSFLLTWKRSIATFLSAERGR